jgi:small GTP-binding protein
VVGEGRVGKTSLIQKFTQNSFNESYLKTLGAAFSLYEDSVDGNTVKIIIWDIAGQDDFNFLRPSFFKNSRASIIVFDLEDSEEGRESFDRITDWHQDVIQYSGDVPILLLGNKSDLIDLDKIDHAKIQVIVEQEKFLGYFITSAKTGDGVKKAFNIIIKNLYGKENSATKSSK